MASPQETDIDRQLVLALDLGTTGLKVGLVSLRGEVVWWDHTPLLTSYTDDGGAVQDAAGWWQLVIELARRGVATTGRGGDVTAVGITGQWASTVPVDAEGLPVSDCVMWMDTRGGKHSSKIVGGPVEGYNPMRLATWVRRTAGVPSTSGGDAFGNLLHLQHDRPDVAATARWYLEPVDYLAMRFTGVAAASHMSMTGAWLTDNRRLDVMAYDAKLIRLSGIDPSKLPPLLQPGSVVGSVLPAVAEELGIAPGAQVLTGMPDLHAATVGSGCTAAGQSHLSIGTTGWVSTPLTKKRTDVFRQMASVPGTSPGSYLLGNNQDSAARCLQWFRDGLAGWDDVSLPSYEEVLAAAAAVPPGAGGVVFTPWLTGEHCPVDDADARAGFHHLSVTSTKAELARAVLEGVGFNTRWMLEAADHFVGRRLDPLRVVGGGARSDLWCQIIADICDRSIERVAEPLLTGLRGVALAAATGLGVVSSEDLYAMVAVDRVFTPDPANRAVYDELFAEFPQLYKAQRSLSRTLARLGS